MEVRKRRVVVTGLGVVSAVGNSVPQFWDSLKEGMDGIRPITLFDTSSLRTHNGGEVIDLPLDQYFSIQGKKRGFPDVISSASSPRKRRLRAPA